MKSITPPKTVRSSPTDKSAGSVTLLLASSITAFDAGSVQKTFFVPEPKFTAESLFDEEIIVVLASVSGVASVTVPSPTSNAPSSLTMA